MRQSILRTAMVAATAMASLAMPASATTPAGPKACALARKAASDAVLSVPFRVVDGRIYVTAKVDGKGPFVFAVDTGASGMGRADAGLVATLGIPLVGSSHMSDGVATAEVSTVRLGSVNQRGRRGRGLITVTDEPEIESASA